MSIYNEELWTYLKQKVQQEDDSCRADLHINHQYLSSIKKICDFAVCRAKLIRDTFPMYTLHDETHITNVMRIMTNLLGDKKNKLRRDEAAMLILAACCHDIGMSYDEAEKSDLLADWDRFKKYLNYHPDDYVRVYAEGKEKPEISDDIIRSYLRSIHHERVEELLYKMGWPDALDGWIDMNDLVEVCQSHGKDISSLDRMIPTTTVDLRFCAILLRLSDILDFDASRAPQAVYENCGFDKKGDPEAIISKKEWEKHRSSLRFDFDHTGNRSLPYDIPYYAKCSSQQVEQAINSYLDWVDQELYHCTGELRRYTGRWDTFILPAKIERHIIVNRNNF